MRVLVDTSYLALGRSGTAVYVERLVQALREETPVEVVEAEQPRRFRRGGENPLRSAANAALDFDWLHRGLPQAARRADADVVHHPLPAYAPRIRCAQVSTFHDLAFRRLPGAYGALWRRLAGRQYRQAARRCDALVCVSEATARDLVELIGASREKIVVARHGPGQALPAVERAEGARHFLYVGDAEPRKGVSSLLRAYSRYRRDADDPLALVLAGAAARLADGREVWGEEDPSPARLAELLASAAALVHPSLHEGFGLTLAEAMAAGAPVVAVRNAGTEELCGDAALLVGADELATALTRISEGAELRERLSAAGRERAASLSWGNSARDHERAYTLAVRNRQRAGGPG